MAPEGQESSTEAQVKRETTFPRLPVRICVLWFIQSSSDYFISSSLFNERNPTTPHAYTPHSLSLETISLYLL